MYTVIVALAGLLTGVVVGLLLSIPIFHAAMDAAEAEAREGRNP